MLSHGERPRRRLVLQGGWVFQSTLSHGERRAGGIVEIDEFIFQSTLSHGERRDRAGQHRLTHPHFNPRSRTESDDSLGSNAIKGVAFQSMLSHGERPRVSLYMLR